MCIYYFLCEAIFDSRIAYLLSVAHAPPIGHGSSYSATGRHNFGHGSAQLHESGELWVMFLVWHSLFDCRCFHNNNFWKSTPRLRSATTWTIRLLYEESHVVSSWHHELTEFARCCMLVCLDVLFYDCMLACSSLLAQVCNLHTFIDWRPTHEVFRVV